MASVIQFQFPECQRVPLETLITRASDQGIEIMKAMLMWDPDKRPTAQQSLRHSYFHSVKGKPSAVAHLNGKNLTSSEQFKLTATETHKPPVQPSLQQLPQQLQPSKLPPPPAVAKYGTNLNDLNSIISVNRIPPPPQFSMQDDIPKSQTNGSTGRRSVLNDIFDINDDAKDDERVHDVYFNRHPDKSKELGLNILNDTLKSMKVKSPVESKPRNNGGFYLHAKKPSVSVESGSDKSNKCNEDSDYQENKVYNVFSKLPKVNGVHQKRGQPEEGGQTSVIASKAKRTPILQTWAGNGKDSFEDDELATILG